MSKWNHTTVANKREGHCVYCETPIAASAGLLVWYYGEPDFEDEDNSCKPTPKIWGVRCTDADHCKRRAVIERARLEVRAAEESLHHVNYGDWTDEGRAAARTERQQIVDAARNRLAELEVQS